MANGLMTMKFLILFIVGLLAVMILAAVLLRKRPENEIKTEKYVCDICHGTECECRKTDS